MRWVNYKREDITPEMVREFLDYDPETGALTWRHRNRKWFSRSNQFITWNKRFAGKPALATINGQGRLSGKINGIEFLAHRVAWCHHFGSWPKNDIDHKDGDHTNNRISNMRDVTHTINLRNRKKNANNKSGRIGVYFCRQRNKWKAVIGSGRGGKKYLGSFDTIGEAAAARKAAEAELGYHRNHSREKT